MHENTRKVVTGVAALAAAGGITAGIAGAAKDGGGQRDRGDGPLMFGHGGGPRGEQEALTGDAKTKAEAAALEAVPGGTVVRSESGGHDGATYHVHVTDADGTPVMVLLDEDFKVTRKLTGPPEGGRGGPRPAQLTGDTAAKAKAAALGAVKDGTVRASFAAPAGADGAYVVFVERKSGRPVVLLLDKDFKVVRRLTRPRFGGRGGHPCGPPPGAAYRGAGPETTST